MSSVNTNISYLYARSIRNRAWPVSSGIRVRVEWSPCCGTPMEVERSPCGVFRRESEWSPCPASTTVLG